MKNIVIIILSFWVVNPINAQNLLEVYKSGSVVLTPDAEYARSNNWNEIFSTYYDTIYNKPLGQRKSLKLMPDGSVVVNHSYKDFYSLFAPDGSFEKEFSLDKKPGVPQKHVYNIAGVVNGNTFYSDLDDLGNMMCFDFDGNYRKKLKLNYMTKQMIALPNGKIAVVGWALWTKKIREFVCIIDYDTNDQQDIWERFAERPSAEDQSKRPLFHYSYVFPAGGMMSCSTMPFAKLPGFGPPPQIASVGNNLIIAVPSTGEILVFDLDGNQISKDKITWATNFVSVEEQKEIQEKAIEKYKNLISDSNSSGHDSEKGSSDWNPDLKSAYGHMIPQMEADLKNITKPIPIPYFSTILKDSDDNILFFEYPKDEGGNKFNVWIYQNDGAFICQSSFRCADYDLQINPAKMVFHDGYIYSLQALKQAAGVPLRLVRFKVAGS
jgi:hypothetical protein